MPTISRRAFLHIAGATLAPFALPPWRPRMAFSPPGQSRSGDLLVCIFLRGAMDGLHAVVPYAEADYYRARPTLAVPEPAAGGGNGALDLDGFFGLHPALMDLFDLFQAGDLAIVHACGSPDPTHSHFDAQGYMERGTPGEKSMSTGWIARHLLSAQWQNDSPFRAVGISRALQASLRGPITAAAVPSLGEFRLRSEEEGLPEVLTSLQSLYGTEALSELGSQIRQQAAATFNALDVAAALDPNAYSPEGGATYPNDPFGEGLAQIALLAKAEIGLEVACLDLGGWDTHIQQGTLEGRMPGLLETLGAGLGAFYRDLGSRMGNVTLVTMSEFGRRLRENGGEGTDHGHGGVMFALGGGIQGGRVYGDWPGLAEEALYGPGDLAVTTDFRAVLSEILRKRVGNDRLDDVFPGFTPGQDLGLAQQLAL